jgi:hypothetical protein
MENDIGRWQWQSKRQRISDATPLRGSKSRASESGTRPLHAKEPSMNKLPELGQLPVQFLAGVDLLHFAAGKNAKLAEAILTARMNGISLETIIETLLAQLPNILTGNWQAVIAAIIALFTPPAALTKAA